jgi:hypothetical protein
MCPNDPVDETWESRISGWSRLVPDNDSETGTADQNVSELSCDIQNRMENRRDHPIKL